MARLKQMANLNGCAQSVIMMEWDTIGAMVSPHSVAVVGKGCAPSGGLHVS